MNTITGEPLVSTIVPVYNGEKYVADAIQSALAQTYRSQEVIVVDDGSMDSTARIVAEFGNVVRYVHQPNRGTAAARNHGAEIAKGEYIAFLDHDDLWLKEKLACQVAACRSAPEPDIVFTHLHQFHSPELDSDSRPPSYCPPMPMAGILASTMMVSRVVFFRIGLFDTQWQFGEWPDWYIQAVENGFHIKVLPELLVYRRLHQTNKGVVQRHLFKEYPKMLKASLDRRRANDR